jgi:uncharacterized protein (TIRG00374 family)
VKTSIRILVTIALCALLLIYVVDLDEVFATLRRCDPWWALAALAALTLDRVLMSYKWGLLLAIRGYAVTLAQKLMVYCSAMMWGLALPSTVGADGIRVVLVRRFGVRVDDCLATILVERGVGFVSALAMAILGLIILRTKVPHEPVYDIALVGGMLGVAAAIGVLVFSFSSNALTAALKLLPGRLAESKIARLLTQLHDAYRSLAVDRRRLAYFSTLTFLEQVLMVACYGLTAKALGVDFSALFLLAAVPLAILISRLPVSLDGIGVYEAIFMAVMTLGGVRPEDSLAVALAARALQIIVWTPWWLALIGQTGAMRPPKAAEPSG